MAVDPYAPCPCGSGEKFKWCCQKVEAFAERAHRMYENGQVEAALAAIDEGLRKEPNNSWLLARKAGILTAEEREEAALPILHKLLERHPGHIGAHSLLVRCLMNLEGPFAAAAQLQQALSHCPTDRRASFALLARMVAAGMMGVHRFASALAHLELASRLHGPSEGSEPVRTMILAIESNAGIPPWFKDDRTLAPAPDTVQGAARDQWNQALEWAGEGQWTAAGSAFELLSGRGTSAADRNLAFCRLWVGDEKAAAEALGRYVTTLGSATAAVDFEAVRQMITPPEEDDLVELVQLIWPLKNRANLLSSLAAANDVVQREAGPMDPDDETSPVAEPFALLDRPLFAPDAIPRGDELPNVQARVLVGQEIVALEAHDDERLEALSDRFTTLAGKAIPPAHPRTKVLGKDTRANILMTTECIMPEHADQHVMRELRRQHRNHILHHAWPNTPMTFLGGRTPLQAAQAGQTVALRAALMRLELVGQNTEQGEQFIELRKLLGIEPEPELDAATVVIDQAPLSRLHLIPAAQLDDDRLVALYHRARKYSLAMALNRAARALTERPSVLADRLLIEDVYTDLAVEAAERDDRETAFDWLRRGRATDPGARRPSLAASWDCLEIRLKMQFDEPEDWVPDLAAVLERYRNDAEANQKIVNFLVGVGLVELVHDEHQRGRVLLDPRRLQAVLQTFGPRVATATGELGVSATQGGIWTPSGGTGGASGGGIWTPGSAPGAGGGDKPKLIIPGR